MKSTKVLGPTQAGGTPYGPVNRVSGAASVKLPVLAKLTIGSITGAGQYLCHEFETNQQALRERAASACKDATNSGRSRRTAGTLVRPKKLLNALRTWSDSWSYRDFRSERRGLFGQNPLKRRKLGC